jgi:hypothetical protein
MTNACRATLRYAAALILIVSSTRLCAAIKTEAIPDLRPPIGPMDAVDQDKPIWPWIGGAILVIAAAVFAWPRKSEPKPADPPAARARREIVEMRPIRAERLGEITRRYFAETLTVPGPALTFDELAAILAQDPRWTPLLKEKFRRIADPLEIARFAPVATEANLEELRDEALALIAAADELHRPAVPVTR